MKVTSCIYCNSKDYLTKDHVPPKSFFPDPKPSDLITVDSCYKCNKGFEKDDEYFKTIVLMRHDVGEHKTGSKQLAKLHKMFQRKRSLPFMKSIANSSELRNVFTPAGIYLGKTMAYTPIADRILNFMQRITKGIYFHEMNQCLPETNRFRLFDKSNLQAQPNEVKETLFPIFRELIFNKPKITIGDNVFSYSYMLFADSEFGFIGFFSFFDYVQYIAISVPILEQKN